MNHYDLYHPDGDLIQRFSSSPYHRRSYTPVPQDIQPRRNSYQLAIHTSKYPHPPSNHYPTHPHRHHHHHHHYQHQQNRSQCSSPSSSISSINAHTPTTRSLSTMHPLPIYGESLHRSLSQPAVRAPDTDVLLENATSLLDSPVHALRPAHHKSRTTISSPPLPPRSNRSSLVPPDSMGDSHYCSSVSVMPMTSAYRIVIVRSFASAFALASLFSTEILQTSIHSVNTSFHSLLSFHLSAAISALLLAIHAARIHRTRHRWTISTVLAYDRCSQILIVLATIFTGVWVAMQYFQRYQRFFLLSAIISGISSSSMMIKTFEHILQLSTSLPIPSVKKLTTRLNRFAFIYNALCHFSLVIGGSCLFAIVLFQQYRREYILIASEPCLLLPCSQVYEHQDDPKALLIPATQPIRVNLTMHINEKKLEWQNEPERFIFFVTLLILTIISILPQAGVEWTTSILSMSRRLSLLYYANDETKTTINQAHPSITPWIRCRHYLFALFLGFQEAYLFGSLIKFDVTCLFGLRHTIEILIIYGLGATLASLLLPLIIERISMMKIVSFTSLLHFGTLLLLLASRTSHLSPYLSPLIIKFLLFFSFGLVIGLWSTIAIFCLCKSIQFSSASIFAQLVAIRSLARLLSYVSGLFLCQSILFYLNTTCLLILFAFLLLCYQCCRDEKKS